MAESKSGGLVSKIKFWRSDSSGKEDAGTQQTTDDDAKSRAKRSSSSPSSPPPQQSSSSSSSASRSVGKILGCGRLIGRKQQKNKNKPVEKAQNSDEEVKAGTGGKKESVIIEFPDVELPPSPQSSTRGKNEKQQHAVEESTVAEQRVQHVQSAWTRPPLATDSACGSRERVRLLPLSTVAEANSGTGRTCDRSGAKNSSSNEDLSQAAYGGEQNVGDAAEAADVYNERDESQRRAEQRYQRKSVDMRNVVPTSGGVKIELGPQSEMWSNIVNKSLVGTGIFTRAAVCNLNSGSVLACNPADFTPTVGQVLQISNNFHRRAVFSAAGFSAAHTIYSVESSKRINEKIFMIGVNLSHTEGIFVAKCRTVLIFAAFSSSRSAAESAITDLVEAFLDQGL